MQTRKYALVYRAGTSAGQLYAEDMCHLFHNIKPFMQKWLRLPDDYESIYQRMVIELNAPDFVATVDFVTAWGTK